MITVAASPFQHEQILFADAARGAHFGHETSQRSNETLINAKTVKHPNLPN
jgi:hypothetical protein